MNGESREITPNPSTTNLNTFANVATKIEIAHQLLRGYPHRQYLSAEALQLAAAFLGIAGTLPVSAD